MKNFSAHLALFAAANMFVVGCVTTPDSDEGVIAVEETPTFDAATRTAISSAFTTTAPMRVELEDGSYYEIVRSTAFTTSVTKVSVDGARDTLTLSSDSTPAQRAKQFADKFNSGVELSLEAAAAMPTSAARINGMPYGSNGECLLRLIVVAGDATILALAVVEAAAITAAVTHGIALVLAAGGPITAEIMATATLMANTFLVEAVALITLAIHIGELIAGHADPLIIAALAADLAARMHLLSSSIAATLGVVAVLWNYIMLNVNDVVNAVHACTTSLPPPQNGNPNYTTVGCHQSGGFGINFDRNLATQACRNVIGNWVTDYYRFVVGGYWTCNTHWGDPAQSPGHVQNCNSWVDQCVAGTAAACAIAPPAGGGGGQPVPVAAPVAIAIPVE